MWYVIALILLLILMAFTSGFNKSTRFVLYLVFKNLGNPFYKVGLSYTRTAYEDAVVETLSIGLFFVNIEIDFEKPLLQ